MDKQTHKVIETSETLASAIDEISLHPDKHDMAHVNNGIDEATEVNAKSLKSLNDSLKPFISCTFKEKLLNPEETQPMRAPRPLFMGPAKKNRRTRGGRKNKKGDSTTPKANDAQIVSTPTSAKCTDNKSLDWATVATTKANSTESIDKIDKLSNLGNVQQANTPKRQRSTQNSPNSDVDSSNKPKRPKTFANVVADDLKLQISNKGEIINDVQLNLIESKLMDELNNFLTTSPTSVPTFHTSSFRFGILKLICTDKFSAQWIQNVVNNMPPLWEGAELEIDVCNPPSTTTQIRQRPSGPRSGNRVRRPTIRFFIPHGIKRPSFEEVTNKLQLQNNPLNTTEWIAWKAEDKGDGIFYHVSVDEGDIGLIRARSSRLFYCFSKIKINLPREPNREGQRAVNEGNV